MSAHTYDLVEVQALQQAVHIWRRANPWASHIPYEQFPAKYKLEIEASIKGDSHVTRVAQSEAEGRNTTQARAARLSETHRHIRQPRRHYAAAETFHRTGTSYRQDAD